ncbi:Proline iminopeptidase [Platanthera guangdongensis]|uniref:Proline iminopeptidase n=1 Tax=Platanthera guangdongensis TaxID=2320717 RepID=A0ABR2LD63_9ASPA
MNQQGGILMDLSLDTCELKRSLYSPIEPYSTGFLQVSDIHKLYWEQSGNPAGHATALAVNIVSEEILSTSVAALSIPSAAAATSPLLHTDIPDSPAADFPDSENLTDAQTHEQLLSTDEGMNRMIEELTSKEPLSPIPAVHPSSPAKYPEQPDLHPEPSPQRSSPVQEPAPSLSENAPDAEVVSIHDSEDEIEAAELPLPSLHFKISSFIPIDAEDEDITVNKKKASTSTVVLEEISPWTAPAVSPPSTQPTTFPENSILSQIEAIIIIFDQVLLLIHLFSFLGYEGLESLDTNICQRGAGKSTPHACLEENTTWNLVNDIELLRNHLQIPEWQVTGLILRGIFLLRKKELDWFYEGGAAAIFPDDQKFS